MREIKFRGVKRGGKEFVYGYLFQDEFKSWILYEEGVQVKQSDSDGPAEYDSEVKWVNVDPETVGQFTGLKDKNQVEIFDGDIVETKFYPHYVKRISWQGPPDAVGKIFWDHSGFRFYFKGQNDDRYADWYDLAENAILDMSLKHTKIIGNIHQNPELLEES